MHTTSSFRHIAQIMIRQVLRSGLYQCVVHYLQRAPPPNQTTRPTAAALQSVWRYYGQRSYSNTSMDPTDSSPDSQTVTCWKCGRQIQTVKEKKVSFFCPCDKRVILPPSVKNYFTILECDPLGVDVGALKRKHTELQRSLHPDKFSIKSKIEQEYSAEQSALINAAYSTLSKPYSRGLYLMELHGVTISETDNYVAAGDSGKYLDFLEEVMELRAAIHSLGNSPNPDLAQVKELWRDNSAQVQAYTREFEECFEKGDLDGAKEALSKMKYYVTNSEMLHPLLPDE